MEQEKMNRFVKLFESERERISRSRRVVDAEIEVSPDDRMDDLDLAASENDRAMRVRIRSREALYGRKIEDAVKRIRSGHFGNCRECEAFIGWLRLAARPTASLCVDCKREEERGEAHANGARRRSKSNGESGDCLLPFNSPPMVACY